MYLSIYTYIYIYIYHYITLYLYFGQSWGFTNTPMWVYHQLALHFVRPYLGDYIRECLTIPEEITGIMTLDDVQTETCSLNGGFLK